MNGEVFIGHHCSVCGTTIGVSGGVGGPLNCPGCGGPMQAAPGGPSVRVLTNVSCKNCGTKIGMMSVVGTDSVNCPSCGESIE